MHLLGLERKSALFVLLKFVVLFSLVVLARTAGRSFGVSLRKETGRKISSAWCTYFTAQNWIWKRGSSISDSWASEEVL